MLRNQATGEERSTTSDRAGEYQMASIQPGVYRLEVRASGFQSHVVTNTRIEVAQTVVQNVRLALGNLTDEIAVIGAAR